MNVQEQEERDFYPENWQQAAFNESMAFRKPDDSEEAENLRKCGRFVLVLDSTEFCPVTDAIMGRRRRIKGDFDTLLEAEQDKAMLAEDYGDNEDIRLTILIPDPQDYDLRLPPPDDEDQVVPF